MVFHNPQPWFNTLCNLVADLFIVGGQKKVLKIGLHHFIVETFQYSSVKKCFQDMHGCTRSLGHVSSLISRFPMVASSF